MDKYYFTTSEFGVSDNGVHLLRSGYNYRTINYSEIKRARIIKGKELDNWFIIFLIGLTMLVAGLFLTFRLIDTLMTAEVTRAGLRLGYLFFIPVVGAFFVYQSFQTGLLLKLEFTDNRTSKFPLRQIVKADRLNEFQKLFKEKLESRLSPGTEKYAR
jgi:hypothetical protein